MLGRVRGTASTGRPQLSGAEAAARVQGMILALGFRWPLAGELPLPPSAGLSLPTLATARSVPQAPASTVGSARPCLPRAPGRRGSSATALPRQSQTRAPSVTARGAPPRPGRGDRVGRRERDCSCGVQTHLLRPDRRSDGRRGALWPGDQGLSSPGTSRYSSAARRLGQSAGWA